MLLTGAAGFDEFQEKCSSQQNPTCIMIWCEGAVQVATHAVIVCHALSLQMGISSFSDPAGNSDAATVTSWT